MTVMIGLLRGVNVGGRAKLAMADLRASAEACGYTGVRSYIQSGNVVFSAPSDNCEAAGRRLRRAIGETAGLQPEVVVRTHAELAAVVDESPFLRRGEDPAHLHVVFMGGSADAAITLADLRAYAPEEAVAVGRQIHLFLLDGVGRSKLAVDLGRQKGPTGTMRNWRTVTKLVALAGELEP